MFNSREYEWADVTAIAGGRDLTGLRAVKYTTTAEREPIYAKGRNPHSIQTGNFAHKGEIKMLQSEYDAMVNAGKGSVLSLAIDVTVGYGNPLNGDAIKIDRLEGVRFLEESNELKQGDKFQEITLPFVCINIKRNV